MQRRRSTFDRAFKKFKVVCLKKKKKMARVPNVLRTRFSLMVMLIMCMWAMGVEAQGGQLPPGEVEALREIAAQLGKRDWNFRVNPCINDSSWVTPLSRDRPLYNNSVYCNCDYPGGVCHVHSIFLKGQDLPGVLPKAIAKLPYLKHLDLNRNYLRGKIPSEWASTKLEYLAISGNNFTGKIPSYLGSITTLKILSIESNLFSGTIPPELGNLRNLENLIFSANNLSGTLPSSLSNLTKLTEVRFSSNNFVGRIPDFIRRWTNLEKLEIQGSGLEGPIPSGISVLTNLTELMLRNCNISGDIPDYLSRMDNLQTLDLSFNKLRGHIPSSFEGLGKLQRLLKK